MKYLEHLLEKFTNIDTTQMLLIFIAFVGIVYMLHIIADCEGFDDEKI